MRQIIFLTFIVSTALTSCGQTKSNRTFLGLDYAKHELLKCKQDKSSKQILVDTLIKTQETAIKVAETLLFEIYGEQNIVKQRPYEVYNLEGYWIIKGTLPKGSLGGTFLIITNSTNGQVIKLTHGK